MALWKPNPEPEYEFDLNPYESFMRRHLQHYGYYTGRNAGYRHSSLTTFEEWDKTHGYGQVLGDSSSDLDSDDSKDKQDDDNKTQEELLRTTQLVYSYQAGKMVPKLREPRQLYGGFSTNEAGIQQAPRWPAEIQVLNEQVKHIPYVPPQREPFYKATGTERCPMAKSIESGGKIVYEYEPIVGSFFMRSRVGGSRGGCMPVATQLQSKEDKTLIFESRFESGNLCKAVQVGEFDYELWLRNDLYTNKHTQWFYFRLSNTRKDVTYRFTIVNLMKPDSLYNHGMKPLMYSEKMASEQKIGWMRTGDQIKYYRNNVKYTMAKQERYYYSLTWTCQMQCDRDTVYFAHCFPYTYSDLQDYLAEVANDTLKAKICKQRVLCHTLAGNMVYILTITSPTKTTEELKYRKAVVVTSRVHPGETNASWMMKGFLDYLLGNSADAKLLRDTFIFKIVPMLNPDGVIVGNYRCSLAGRDLNRNYKTVLKDSFPSVWHTKNMIKKLCEEREIIVYCDLHGHSRRQNVFIYGCENRNNPSKRLRERIFPVMLNKNAPDKFSFDSCKFKVQKSKDGTGRIVMWHMGIMNSYTLEATFAGSSMGKLKGYHFTTADFESMGFHFCDTLLDYCDPDNSKSAKILVELEDRMRQEILNKLQKQGVDTDKVSLDEIDLDEDYTSGVESSDGGSDSSMSDGLPVHLQYLADKLPKRKKRLKSKKERDKQKSEKKLQATPITEVTEKLDNHSQSHTQAKPRPIKCNLHRRQKDTQTSSQGREDQAQKKTDGNYLNALTTAYLQSGMLLPNDQQSREVPHFRYTGANHPPVGNIPINLDGLCPHHDKTFAAQYVASHLQQYTYPDVDHPHNWPLKLGVLGRRTEPPVVGRKIPDETIAKILALTRGTGDDLEELPRYKYSMKPPSARSLKSPIDRKVAQRHLVELSAAQQRQQDLLLQEQRRQYYQAQAEREAREVNSPIKQHPPPFDSALERDKSHDYVKRGYSAHNNSNSGIKSRTASATSSHSRLRSAKLRDRRQSTDSSTSIQTPLQEDVAVEATAQSELIDSTGGKQRSSSANVRTGGRVDSAEGTMGQNVMVDQSALHNALSVSAPAVITSEPPKQASVPPRQGSASSLPHVDLQTNRITSSSSSSNTSRNQLHQAKPAGAAVQVSQPVKQAAEAQINSTIKSINEIRESLMNTARRANLSPTTGKFIDSIVKQTDEEINALTAELHSDLQKERPVTAGPAAPLPPPQTVPASTAHRLHPKDSTHTASHVHPRKAREDDPSGHQELYANEPCEYANETNTYASEDCVAADEDPKENHVPLVQDSSAALLKPTRYKPSREASNVSSSSWRTDNPAARVSMAREHQILPHRTAEFDQFNNYWTPEEPQETDIGMETVYQIDLAKQAKPHSQRSQQMAAQEPQAVPVAQKLLSLPKSDTQPTTPSQVQYIQFSQSLTDRGKSSQGSRVSTGKSPTKISLMISRGHHQDYKEGTNSGQFYPHSLTRSNRPPQFRNTKRR